MSATFPLKLAGTTGAPFTAVGSVGGSNDADNLSERYSSVAVRLWDRLIGTRDALVALVLINVIHLSIATRQQSSETLVDSCAVNSVPSPAHAYRSARVRAPG